MHTQHQGSPARKQLARRLILAITIACMAFGGILAGPAVSAQEAEPDPAYAVHYYAFDTACDPDDGFERTYAGWDSDGSGRMVYFCNRAGFVPVDNEAQCLFGGTWDDERSVCLYRETRPPVCNPPAEFVDDVCWFVLLTDRNLATGSGYFPLSPERLLDTRPASQVGEYSSPWGSGVTRSVQVGGLAGVPADGVEAVAIHVTTVNPVADTMAAVSWLNAYASDETPGATAVHNFGTGDFTTELVNDLLVVGVGADGKIMLSNENGEVDLVIDVVGYFANGGDQYTPTSEPVRIVDSRSGATNIGAFSTPWAQAPRSVTVAGGTTQVPATASAVAIHVTTVNPVARTMAPASWLTMYPTGETAPATAVHNFGTADFTTELVNDLVIAKVGANGQIDIANAFGEVDLVIDIVGYFESSSGSTYMALTPGRALDTRNSTPVGPGNSLLIQTPAMTGCTAVAMHVTAVNPVADTMASVSWLASNPAALHNFGTGDFTTELVNDLIIGTVSGSGSSQGIVFTNTFGEVDLIVDIVGVFDDNLTASGCSV